MTCHRATTSLSGLRCGRHLSRVTLMLWGETHLRDPFQPFSASSRHLSVMGGCFIYLSSSLISSVSVSPQGPVRDASAGCSGFCPPRLALRQDRVPRPSGLQDFHLSSFFLRKPVSPTRLSLCLMQQCEALVLKTSLKS